MPTSQTVIKTKQLQPLTILTPVYPDESISSWLIRAALNQGCDPLVFTQYYWSEYRLWTYDPDKGFSHIDDKIHNDMANLAKSSRQFFDSNNLMKFASDLELSDSYEQINIPWTHPLSKRNRRALIGYPYCPLCMQTDNEARLKLSWRFTWTLYCHEHHIKLQNSCSQCGQPYQPQMLEANLRYINHCHSCQNKLVQDSDNQPIDVSQNQAYTFQKEADTVLLSRCGYSFNQQISIKDWFELMAFYIKLIRRASINPDYMFGKLLYEFGLNVNEITPPKTGLRLNQLLINERIELLGFTIRLNQIDYDSWVKQCQELNITKNSFNWSKYDAIPKAFIPIYEQLPQIKTRKRKCSPALGKPRSPEAVMKQWARLQRKAERQEYYDQDRPRYSI